MKRAMPWSFAVPCLLAVAGLLAGCDARQWPLAEYRSGQPKATAWREPATPARRQTTAGLPSQAERKSNVSKPAPPPEVSTATNGPVTASAAMPGPMTENQDTQLIGLNMTQARQRLGPPTQEIEQAPAKVWRYRTAQCSLDVSLYPDVHTQVFRVLNYEVKGNDGTEQGRRKCISELRAGALSR